MVELGGGRRARARNVCGLRCLRYTGHNGKKPLDLQGERPGRRRLNKAKAALNARLPSRFTDNILTISIFSHTLSFEGQSDRMIELTFGTVVVIAAVGFLAAYVGLKLASRVSGRSRGLPYLYAGSLLVALAGMKELFDFPTRYLSNLFSNIASGVVSVGVAFLFAIIKKSLGLGAPVHIYLYLGFAFGLATAIAWPIFQGCAGSGPPCSQAPSSRSPPLFSRSAGGNGSRSAPCVYCVKPSSPSRSYRH